GNVLKCVTGTARAHGLCVKTPPAGVGKTTRAVLVVKPVKVKMVALAEWLATVAVRRAAQALLPAARLRVVAAIVLRAALPAPAVAPRAVQAAAPLVE